jgi:thiol-disulfide isomerase/thioredoxin
VTGLTGLTLAVGVLAVAGSVAVALRLANGLRGRRARGEILTAADLGSELGSRATLVQFSSAFCSPCRATRVLLRDVTAPLDDVTHIEIDAESHLDLVRRLGIVRTPTVVVLDSSGGVVRQASGLPRREQVVAVLAGI